MSTFWEIVISQAILDHLDSCGEIIRQRIPYTRTNPLKTGTKLVWISVVFTRDLVDPVQIGSATWYQMGQLMIESQMDLNISDPV